MLWAAEHANLHAKLHADFPFAEQPFAEAALAVFRFQAQANAVYARWLSLLHVRSDAVETIEEIPYLPIEFYKRHSITALPTQQPQHVFLSSRTTGQLPSQHLVYDMGVYEQASLQGFERTFGPVSAYYFISLLPSYSHLGASSLVYMVHHLARQAGQPEAHTMAATLPGLEAALAKAHASNKIPLVFGVTHALLGLALQGQCQTPFMLIETGGMKGHGPEHTRAELHEILAASFPKADIRSEYGMTELFSQGYTSQHLSEAFVFPPWVRAVLRDPADPLAPPQNRARGTLAIIDLANIDTCAFIATADLAEQGPAGMAILGRLDHAEIRGCNLLTL